jgi:hypothetical protein
MNVVNSVPACKQGVVRIWRGERIDSCLTIGRDYSGPNGPTRNII